MRNYRLPVLIASSALLISGCSNMPFAGKDGYTSAKAGAALEIPPDLTKPAENDRYAVPEEGGSATLSTYQESRKKEESTVLPEIRSAKMEEGHGERWLVAQGTPDAVWPKVKEFWQKMGFTLKVDNPDTGIIETDWQETHPDVEQEGIRGLLHKYLGSVYSTGIRNKYRTRLERGDDGKSTRIYISQSGMEEVLKSDLIGASQTVWQPTKPNPELEAEMLSKLMVSFGVPASEAKVAGLETMHAKARLSEQDNDITLDMPADRAWRQVGLALDRAGFSVDDQDRSKGVYFVTYADPGLKNKEDSFLSSLEFWKDKEKAKPQKYRIQISAGGSGSIISILDKDGFTEHTETSMKILKLLYEQLK